MTERYFGSEKPDLDDLLHYGVKGMKWGVRKDRRTSSGTTVSRKTDRQAKKDAQEYARAKAFYGQGAGTRRKLIQQTVDGRSKNTPGYKEAFQKHLDSQDTSRHASKAVSERRRRDRVDTAKKSGSYVARKFTGEMGTKAAFTALAVGGVAYVRSPNGQRMMNKATNTFNKGVDEVKRRRGAAHLNSYFKNFG